MLTNSKFQKILSTVFIVVILLSSVHTPAASTQGGDGIKRQVNTETGKVSFIGPESGRALPAARALGTFARPQDPAMALAKRFASEFGIKDAARELSEITSSRPGDGRVIVIYQQEHQGIPVIGGELIVNTNERGDLYSMSGEVSPDLALLPSGQPSIDSAQAAETALQALAKWYQKTPADFNVSQPELWIFDESLLQPSPRPVELVWRMEVTPKELGMPVRELVLVNAERGNISLHFNQVDTVWGSNQKENSNQVSIAIPEITKLNDVNATPNSSIEPMPMLLGATWYVATTGNDSNSCTAIGSPCLTINGAIGKAIDGDLIKVAVGTYTGSDPWVVFITKSVTLSGGWNAAFTSQSGSSTIDGQNTRLGVFVSNGIGAVTVTLDRFIIKNGKGVEGGGVYNDRGYLTILNSSIQNNSVSGSGGGIYNNLFLILNNTTIANNSAAGYGGGIYYNNGNSGANQTLDNTTISNNSAGYGGGIYIFLGNLTLNNTTVSNNSATPGGGQGGGVSNIYGVVTLQNSILARNTAAFSSPDCKGVIGSSGYNLIGNNSGCTYTGSIGDLVGVNASPINPQLATLQDNGSSTFTHALMYGSPAINAGNPATCLPTDQRGTARVGTCDIGAYEYENTPGVSIIGGTPQITLINSMFPTALKVLVIDNSKNAVSNALVTFTAPSSGSSGTFASTGTFTATATTNVEGIAIAPIFTSNNLAGTYSVIPSVSGISTLANFELMNINPIIKTYTANNTSMLPGTLLCDQTTFNCTSGNNPHADAVHKYAIGTYELYISKHNRNSIDNAGMTIISTVHYDSLYSNAFWDGSQAVYGDNGGWPLADDVVAHELTHGVTEHESNLFYYYQSGAINESFSDLWGEYYDQTNGQGNDSAGAKWQVGEDISDIGAIRSMSYPTTYGNPDRMTSPSYYNGDGDNGGVHYNSGVNNKAAYLMVEGGSFNGKNVAALGWEKTAAIYYEANTNLLTSGSNYSDLYYALQEACKNLTGKHGITAGDCVQVKNAIDAVEMSAPANGGFYPAAPTCAASLAPTDLFQDNFESGTSNWDILGSGQWRWDDWYATSATHMMWGDDYASSSDSMLTMKNGIYLAPGNYYLHFRHAFLFENDYSTYYDGGVLEYSINNGATWLDAAPLFSAGKNYSGTVDATPGTSNALKGRWAFVGDSHGYVSSRYDLAILAGQTVKFRWRFATDQYSAFQGWAVDDVRIYKCVPHIFGNVGAAGVSLGYTDGTPKIVISDNKGNYSIPVPSGWGGTVTPSLAGVTFTPANLSYSNVTANQIEQNYTASITLTGNAGVGGATLSYTDGTVKTVTANGVGNYSIMVPYGWSGIVVPYKTGYRFTPASKTYSNTKSDQINQNYTAEVCAVCVSAVLRTDPSPTDASNVNFTVMFSDTVTGVDPDAPFSDFALTTTGVTGVAITGVSGSGNTYIVTVNTGSGNGTIRLNVVDDDSIKDVANNPLGGVNAGNGNYTSGEMYTIQKVPTFGDVPFSYWANSFIERLYNAGVTGGCTTSPLNYCPETEVTRAQMAVFILRGRHGPSYTPPAVGASTGFTDVPVGYWAAAWIKQLAAEGITSGCGTGNYCPEVTVTRAQMAIFLLRAEHGSVYTPPAATGVFTDVPVGHWADKWIEQLAVEGITGGCGAGVYCPETAVTRAQMAVFLVKTFNLP